MIDSVNQNRAQDKLQAGEGSDQFFSALVVTLALGAVIGLLMLVCGFGTGGRGAVDDTENAEKTDNKPKKSKTTQQGKRQLKQPGKRATQSSFSHAHLASTLKEHSNNVLDIDFSINGKYLASCAEDRTVRVWSVKEFKEKEHKCVRGNVEYDHATQIKFSPDCRAFITSLSTGNNIRVFKLAKKEDGVSSTITASLDFPKKHITDIINIGLGSHAHGSFVMTAYKDTTIHIWDVRGEVLQTIDTHHMSNNYAAVSPCGRFVASCGFTPDVKVWEVIFDKEGNFSDVKRVMDLKGHRASVYYFSFNIDSTRMATVSKDATWKLWDTNVEYNKNQDPYLLLTGSYDHTGPSILALSPDAYTVAIATGAKIWVFDSATGKEEEMFEDVHAQPITKLGFDPSNKYLVSCGDRHIRVFHNVVGYRSNIASMEEKIKSSTINKSQKERLQNQITQMRDSLAEILGEKPKG
ncbi:transducin beta-like protein 2 [Acanthaster planci]|uniref:Transducin beta-like protein 2 n=1 Tax=Acanthaster planci TaxID=133434 RepID=A0A8B7ZY22_ACAPL|nr:transducin beta-like protein 2 [Acanthaster planci]